MQIDETFVDSHLEAIPRLGTLTTGSFPGGDAKGLGWHSHWSLHLQLLVLGTTDQISANCAKTMQFQLNSSLPHLQVALLDLIRIVLNCFLVIGYGHCSPSLSQQSHTMLSVYFNHSSSIELIPL